MFDKNVAIHPDLLAAIMGGSPAGQRFTQDTPVLPEVWMHCAAYPGQPVKGLIVPRKNHQAHHVAAEVYERLHAYRNDRKRLKRRTEYGISDMPGLVTVRCYFDEVVNVILPLTRWWVTDGMEAILSASETEIVKAATCVLGDMQAQMQHIRDGQRSSDTIFRHLGAHFASLISAEKGERVSDNTARLLVLLGVISAAQNGYVTPEENSELDGAKWVKDLVAIGSADFEKGLKKVLQTEFLKRRNYAFSRHYKRQVAELRARAAQESNDVEKGSQPDHFDFQLIFTLSTNRQGDAAVFNSVPTTKADAARRLFSLSDSSITWAVIDSGIDSQHYAFRKYPEDYVSTPDSFLAEQEPLQTGKDSRVVARYKLAFVHALRDRDVLFDPIKLRDLAEKIAAVTDFQRPGSTAGPKTVLEGLLEQAADDLHADRPLDWDLVERVIRVRHDHTPSSPHGTHVAGTLGGCWPEMRDGKKIWIDGMCPRIKLMDFDVLGDDIKATEFAVVAALRLIRHLNDRNDFKVIHGANLSLSIPHDVTNYACGQTPVCAECERLVNNGVVVVAAAGNAGYNVFNTSKGQVPLHTATSISDPGNAEAVITVGSTHRLEPHTYGVSYFSSRGPTGDGRVKPDLVAPGEKISAPVTDGEIATLEGTSMAAPHVSGAAALLMARFPELIGNPQRIKGILCSTATNLNREKSYQGNGLVDVLRALQSI